MQGPLGLVKKMAARWKKMVSCIIAGLGTIDRTLRHQIRIMVDLFQEVVLAALLSSREVLASSVHTRKNNDVMQHLTTTAITI